jgi:outer membrane protein OmpA-like peptidoglycan-associated protein
MGTAVATRQVAPAKRADPQRSGAHRKRSVSSRPLGGLQRNVGNRALNSLLRSFPVQAKLTIGQPNDTYEREADRVADQVMRMPDGTASATQGISKGIDRISRFTAATSSFLQRAAVHDGRILDEGSCADLVAGSRWICCDPENGFERKGKTKDIEGTECPSEKFTPIFTCDHDCEKALSKQCDDADNWMAIPKSRFNNRKCNQDLVICANGSFTHAYVRDRSEREAWEVSKAIPAALGLSPDFKGVIYGDENDAAFKKDKRCHKQQAPAPKQGNPKGSSTDIQPKLIDGVIQRKCACQEGEQACECKSGGNVIQRQPHSQSTSEETSTSFPQVLNRPGRPLDVSTRNFMESRFGHSFAGVRVHTGEEAAASARAMHAQAYTLGNHIVFGASQYQPSSSSGRRLLAHELTHVVQQNASDTLRRKPFSCSTGVLTDTRCADAQGSGHPAGENLQHFAEEKHDLKPAHLAQIKAFKATWTTAGAKDDLKVHGYASCDGEPDLNVQLSCDRAESVKAELKAQGVTTTISTLAHGETDEFGAGVDDNRRVIIETVKAAPPPPPPPPGLCKGVPATTPATCVGRNGGYCSAASCFPSNPWLQCVCKTSLQICQAIDAFSFSSVQGMQLEACIDSTVLPPTKFGVKFEANSKGNWFFDTNKCIWGHWREALDPLHDASLPIPSSVTAPWRAAIAVCRSKGVGSSECCKAQVDAEQQAIDTCGKYPSSRFGTLPTDIPGAGFCSLAARQAAPSPSFSGDFGNVADRIAHGNKLCCP